jgi:LysM repeat protein
MGSHRDPSPCVPVPPERKGLVAGRVRRGILIVLVAALLGAGLGPTLTRAHLPALPGVVSAASPPIAGHAALSDLEAELLLARAEDARRAADWPLCIDLLTRAAARRPADGALRERLAEAHTNLGWELLVQRRFAEARQAFQAAIQMNPPALGAAEGLKLLNSLAPCSPVPSPASAVAPSVTSISVAASPAAAVCTGPALAGCPPVVHVVVRGETLFSLARRFGTTVRAIMAANSLTSTTIRIGQVLVIPACLSGGATSCAVTCAPPAVLICPTTCPPQQPAACPSAAFPTCPAEAAPTPACQCAASTVRPHVVQRGDNLFRLAASFETSARLLMEVNGLTTTQLRVGQVLIIP